MKYRIFLVLIFFYSVSLLAQDSDIHQQWIWKNRMDCKGEKLIYEENAKWNVEFKENNKALISKNKSERKGESNYSMDDKEIVMNGSHYSIEMLAKDSLILGLKNCEKLLFISRSRLLENQRKNFFKHQGDTIYFSADFNSPKLKGYPNYMNYMTSKLPGKNYMEGHCLIKLQFIVRKNGSLTNSRGSISCHKNADKTIEKLMKQMAGLWEPMYVNNKAVNTLMRINIDHSGTVIDLVN